MRRIALLPCLLALLLPALAASAQDAPERRSVPLLADRTSAVHPPASPREDAGTDWHGERVADPWRWLEDGAAPAVKYWIQAQNEYTEATVAAMPGAAALSERIRALAVASTTRSAPRIVHGRLWYQRHVPPAAQPVLVSEPWPQGGDAVVHIDPNAAGGGTAVTGYWPAPDGRHLAWGTAEGGSELTTLHVLDLETGTRLADTLPWAGGGTTPQGLAWDADGKGFTYVRFPPPAAGAEVRQFDAALVHHRLGDAAAQDRVVFGADYSPIAEYRLLPAPEGDALAVLATHGDGGPSEVFLRREGRWQQVLGPEANVRGAAWIDTRLAVLSFADAPRGKLLAVAADGAVSELLPQRYGALQRVAPIAGGFLVVRSWGPEWWAEHYDARGAFQRRLPLPETGIAVRSIASAPDSARALIGWSGWTTPSRWSAWSAADGTLETIFTTTPPADYGRVRAHRLDGVSRDGTHVPVTVLALDGVTPNGRNPAILYGYGGFDIPMAPSFLGDKLAWLERGGIYAVANLRGGNEFGQDWHAAGQKLDKQNVFDDFHAAATALVESGWTDRARLGIMGGSNGGLLVGSQITQHPADYRAAVALVGIHDMLRHQTSTENGAFNVPEYGDVNDPAQFRATLAYSPLQNVHADTAWPAVLMTTGANDPRVAAWQSRKFTAALQATNAGPHPILLLTRMDAGHGVGAPFSQRVGNAALTLGFLAHQLGLPAEPLPAGAAP